MTVSFPRFFNTILGYDANFSTTTVKPTTNNTVSGVLTYCSSKAPQVQSVTSLLFSIENVNNSYGNPKSLVYSLAPTVSFGARINETPPVLNFCRIQDSTGISQLTIRILNPNNFEPMPLLDPNITMSLVIRDVPSNG
jgi:hypothetical protein